MATTTLGVKSFGRINRVPNEGWIETQFFFIAGVPLIPLGSYVHRSGARHAIVPSLRSIAAAYVSGATLLLGCFMTLASGLAIYGRLFGRARNAPPLGWWIFLIGGWVVFAASIPFLRLLSGRTRFGDEAVLRTRSE